MAILFAVFWFSLVFAFLVGMITIYVIDCKTEVVETYTVGAEVVHTDFSSHYRYKSGGEQKVFIIAVRNDEFRETFEVSEREYAKYTEGDIAVVEVTRLYNPVYKEYSYSYKLL